MQKNQFGSFLIWGMPEKVGWGMPNRGMLLDTHISHVVERLRSLLYNIFITSIYIYNYVCHKLPYSCSSKIVYAAACMYLYKRGDISCRMYNSLSRPAPPLAN